MPAGVPADLPGIVIVDVATQGARLVITSYGSPPRLIGKECIEGDGIAGSCFDHHSGCETPLFNVSEADKPLQVDYSKAVSGQLTLVYCTTDPREPYEDCVPFIKKTIVLDSRGHVSAISEVLLQPETAEEGRIDRLVERTAAAIQRNDETSWSDVNTNLGHLRNIAVVRPHQVLASIEKLQSPSCELSHTIEDYRSEVHQLASIIQDHE